MSFQSSLLLWPTEGAEGETAEGAINYQISSYLFPFQDSELSGDNKIWAWGLEFNSYAVIGV